MRSLLTEKHAVFCVSTLIFRLFNSPLTSVNLLKNNLGDGAAAVIAAAEQNGKIKTLCGIKPDQTEADFSHGLKAADAQLLAFDLKFSSPLKTLNLAGNYICGVNEYGHGTYDSSGIVALSNALKEGA